MIQLQLAWLTADMTTVLHPTKLPTTSHTQHSKQLMRSFYSTKVVITEENAREIEQHS